MELPPLQFAFDTTLPCRVVHDQMVIRLWAEGGWYGPHRRGLGPARFGSSARGGAGDCGLQTSLDSRSRPLGHPKHRNAATSRARKHVVSRKEHVHNDKHKGDGSKEKRLVNDELPVGHRMKALPASRRTEAHAVIATFASLQTDGHAQPRSPGFLRTPSRCQAIEL